MASRSLQRKQLSRSKIELFTECPRCFYLDVARGIPRPSGPPFTLNNAVDALMKAEFDRYRAAGEPHPLFASAGLDAVPFPHADLDRWRHNFTGVRWTDAETGWTLFGAVDDLWQARSGELMVADYKATSRARDADHDHAVSVLSAADGRLPVPGPAAGFRGQRPRLVRLHEWRRPRRRSSATSSASATALVPYDGDDAWVLDVFRRAVAWSARRRRPRPDPSATTAPTSRAASGAG